MSPNFAPQEPEIPTAADTSSLSFERLNALEHEHSNLKQRLGWHIAAWWVLFALLLISWIGFGAWNYYDTDTVRGEYQTSDARLDKRIDDRDTQSQNRLELRSTSLDARVDAILRDLSALKTELATLRVKVETQEALCQNACAVNTSK